MVEASTVVCWLKNKTTVVTHVHMVAGGDGTVKKCHVSMSACAATPSV